MALNSNYRALVPKPPEKYTVGLGAHKLTTDDPQLAQQFLGQLGQDPANSVNPMAAQIAQNDAKGASLDEQTRQITANPPPQQANITADPMPQRDQVAVPHEQQAKLNPLSVLLGLASGFGGQYGPGPAQAVADQIHGDIQQTHANYQNQMNEYGAQVDAAAQRYHDQMEQHNEDLRLKAENNGIDFANANAQYKQRGVLGDVAAEKVGTDTLGKNLTLVGTQMDNKQRLAAQAQQVKDAVPDYLDMLDKATKADQGDANIAHTQAQTAQTTQQTTDAHALQAGKIKDQAAVTSLHTAQVGKTQADIERSKQETEESKQLLPGKKALQSAQYQKIQSDIAGAKEENNLKRLFYQAKLAGIRTGANASDINTALKANDAELKGAAGDLKEAWSQYNDAEFGPRGRLQYLEAQKKALIAQKVPPSQISATIAADPIYRGLEAHSNQVVQQLHTYDANFTNVRAQAAAGRDRIMRSSKVPGAAGGAATPGTLPGGFTLIGGK